jgi:hypothetical protein
MARDESEREDLLREATALVERIELVVDGEHVVAGFRVDGALSIFFGEDPVYQFNAAGELRRGFCDGRLIKSVRGQLVAMQRNRTATEVQLVRHELSVTEQAHLLSRMATQLRRLAASLNSGAITVVGQMPPEVDVMGRLKSWFARHKEWPIAARPNVRR